MPLLILLCSDGLWGMLLDEEIAKITSFFKKPKEICEKLAEVANQAGGKDNITVIVISVERKKVTKKK